MSNEEIVLEIQSGETGRMWQLWEQVERLVKWKANRAIAALDESTLVEFDDLFNSGYIALTRAVETYKPECGAFSTWFMFYLKTAFEEATGYRTKKGRNDPIRHAVSLSLQINEDPEGSTLEDVITDPAGVAALESAEDRVFIEQLSSAIKTVLYELPELQRDILRHRFFEVQTVKETSENLQIRENEVRNEEDKALRKMKSGRIAGYLRPFYDFDYYSSVGLNSFRHTGLSVEELYLVKQGL